MNERIGKLIEQAEEWVCKNYPDAMDDNDEFHAQTMEKFAELIVVECAMFVVTELEGKVGSAIADATANRLEEHFGVEE